MPTSKTMPTSTTVRTSTAVRTLSRSARAVGVVVVAALLVAACDRGSRRVKGGATDCFPASGSGPTALVAQVASYDLAVGPAARFIVGLQRADLKLVAFGTVRMRFAYLDAGTAGCGPTPPATGNFLPLPGAPVPNPPPASAQLSDSAGGRGVYATRVAFNRAGHWEVEVTATLGGKDTTATAAFDVLDHHAVPAPGDAALASTNLTVDTPGALQAAIDSRAASTGTVPDPDLHRQTIAAALAAHRPIVAVFATPVYCVSRFCGPVTDMVESLAKQYADRASFIHVEIWRDFDKKEINKSAAEWLLRNGDLNEPWVFVIGSDGRITARFDNVTTRAELEPLLQSLPVQPK